MADGEDHVEPVQAETLENTSRNLKPLEELPVSSGNFLALMQAKTAEF